MSSLISKKIKHHIRNEFINDYGTGNYEKKKHLDLIRKETEIIEELNEKQLILKNFKNLSKIKNIVCEERVIIENCNISKDKRKNKKKMGSKNLVIFIFYFISMLLFTVCYISSTIKIT